jgi:hypothetical protein
MLYTETLTLRKLASSASALTIRPHTLIYIFTLVVHEILHAKA